MHPQQASYHHGYPAQHQMQPGQPMYQPQLPFSPDQPQYQYLDPVSAASMLPVMNGVNAPPDLAAVTPLVAQALIHEIQTSAQQNGLRMFMYNRMAYGGYNNPDFLSLVLKTMEYLTFGLYVQRMWQDINIAFRDAASTMCRLTVAQSLNEFPPLLQYVPMNAQASMQKAMSDLNQLTTTIRTLKANGQWPGMPVPGAMAMPGQMPPGYGMAPPPQPVYPGQQMPYGMPAAPRAAMPMAQPMTGFAQTGMSQKAGMAISKYNDGDVTPPTMPQHQPQASFQFNNHNPAGSTQANEILGGVRNQRPPQQPTHRAPFGDPAIIDATPIREPRVQVQPVVSLAQTTDTAPQHRPELRVVHDATKAAASEIEFEDIAFDWSLWRPTQSTVELTDWYVPLHNPETHELYIRKFADGKMRVIKKERDVPLDYRKHQLHDKGLPMTRSLHPHGRSTQELSSLRLEPVIEAQELEGRAAPVKPAIQPVLSNNWVVDTSAEKVMSMVRAQKYYAEHLVGEKVSDVFHSFGFIFDANVSEVDANEFLEKLKTCKTFVEAKKVLLAEARTTDPYIWRCAHERLTKSLRRMLRNNLTLNGFNVNAVIFIDDVEELPSFLQRKFGGAVSESYIKHQQEVLQGVFADLDDESAEMIIESVVDKEKFGSKSVYPVLMASMVCLTSLEYTAAELGVSTAPDTASRVEYSDSLMSQVVDSMFSLKRVKDEAFDRFIMETKDGYLLEVSRGYLASTTDEPVYLVSVIE